MTQSSPETLQRQIDSLQQQLQAAREQSGQDMSAPYERQEVHAAVGEQIQQQISALAQDEAVQVPQAAAGAGTDVPSYQDPAIAAQVQELVNVAFTQSIDAAIAQAMKSGNPALIDALHDVLADQLHDELLKRQKL